MLVFTVTNLSTKKVYVGTTATEAEDKWKHLVKSAQQGYDFPLYNEIREFGAENFLVEEWGEGQSRDDTESLELEAISSFKGESIKGYKLLPRSPQKGNKRKIQPVENEEISDSFDSDPFDSELDLTSLGKKAINDSAAENEEDLDSPAINPKNLGQSDADSNRI